MIYEIGDKIQVDFRKCVEEYEQLNGVYEILDIQESEQGTKYYVISSDGTFATEDMIVGIVRND